MMRTSVGSAVNGPFSGVEHGNTVGLYVPMNATGTEAAGVTLAMCCPDAFRERAFADKSAVVRAIRNKPTRKNGRPARTRADVERESDFIGERVGWLWLFTYNSKIVS